MLAPSALIKGLVSRYLPSPFQDDRDTDRPQRLGRYGESYVASLTSKQHMLADEGSYYVTNNAQTGIVTGTAATWAATTPTAVIFNTDSVTSTSKRIYLDYMALVTTAAGGWGSAGVNVQLAVYIDNTDRYTSGGTDMSSLIVNPNMDAPIRSSIAKVRFGAITAPAATGSARCVCGLRIIRPAVSATVAEVVGELKYFNFGGADQQLSGPITIAVANMISHPLPPIIIGPQQSCLIYAILNGTSPTAISWAPEFGWWER